jgi:hypothetical protein
MRNEKGMRMETKIADHIFNKLVLHYICNKIQILIIYYNVIGTI